MDLFTFKHPDGTRIDLSEITLESLGCHLIFGEVREESMKDACNFLLKTNQLFHKQEITIFINSVGGSCHDGFALIDLMEISRLPVRTVSSGTIMSMGVLLACAGNKGKRVMTRNCEVMAHQFSGGMEGKYHEMMAQAKSLDYSAFQFLQHFKRHSSMSEAQIKDVLFGPTDRWLTPQECKKFGLIDIIVDELPPALPVESVPASPARRRSSSRSRGTARQKKRS